MFISFQMYEELCEALNEAAKDKDTVLACVTGNFEKQSIDLLIYGHFFFSLTLLVDLDE